MDIVYLRLSEGLLLLDLLLQHVSSISCMIYFSSHLELPQNLSLLCFAQSPSL